MLTPDQIRLRLDRTMEMAECRQCMQLIAVLHDVLPQLVASARPLHRPESQERGLHGLRWTEEHIGALCVDCTPEQPCERARRLLSGG